MLILKCSFFPTVTDDVYFIPGQRGKLKLVVNGYSFTKNKTTAERLYWNCAQTKSKKCRARVVTPNDENVKTIKTNHIPHNHKSDIVKKKPKRNHKQ